MHSSLGWLFSILALYGSIIFSADSNSLLQLPADVWVKVFNLLPMNDQYRCAQSCKLLSTVFDNLNVAINMEVVSFDTEKQYPEEGFFSFFKDTEKKYAPLRFTCFCKRIAANQLGGSIQFKASESKEYLLFFESLKTNNRITRLDLSGSLLDDRGIAKLASCLSQQHNSSLKSLILKNNMLSAIGVINLLTKLPTLEQLDISHNPIAYNKIQYHLWAITYKKVGDEYLKTLGTVIQNLKILKMNYCSFGDNNINWLIKFLKKNKNLTELHLNHNAIGNSNTLQTIIRTVNAKGNPLKILDIASNGRKKKYDDHIKENLSRFLIANPPREDLTITL